MKGKTKISIVVLFVVLIVLALTYLYNWRGPAVNYSLGGTKKIILTKAGFEKYPFIIIDQKFIEDFQTRLIFRPFYKLPFNNLDPKDADYQITFEFGQDKPSQALYYWKQENIISFNEKNYLAYKDFTNLLEQKLEVLEKKLSPAAVAKTNKYTDDEMLILAMINLEREKAKVKPLKANFKLTQLARMKSQDMINLNYLGHQSPTFGNYNDMISATGTSFAFAGENIVSANTPQGCFEIMMKDKSQRDLILNKKFTNFGVGIVPGGKYGYVLSILFIAQ